MVRKLPCLVTRRQERKSNHTSEQMINMGADERSVKCILKDRVKIIEKIRERRRNSTWGEPGKAFD